MTKLIFDFAILRTALKSD